MELFSNERDKIWQRARQELLENNPNTFVYYSEMPHFSNELSISLEKSNVGEFSIITKWWDKHHDFKKYNQLGFSNLDRLRILEKSRILTTIEKDSLQNILEKLESVTLPDSIEEKGLIVLDGCEYKLIFKIKEVQREYNWKIANYNYSVIEDIIRFLTEKSSLQEFQKVE